MPPVCIENTATMTLIEQIALPVKDFLEQFEREYKNAFRTTSPIISPAIAHLKKSRGKQLRPLLVALSARLFSHSFSAKTLSSALLLELLHAASLIHDDVIDEAHTRRGEPTLNAIYSNHKAVLIGDYLLSKAFLYAIETSGIEEMRIAASVGKYLSEGELEQIDAASQRAIDEGLYYSFIEKKTARLFEAAMVLGALSVQAPPHYLAAVATIGLKVGIAFQIRDDILDYISESQLGKPSVNDLPEGKVTLPLIYAHKVASQEQKAHIEHLIQKAPTHPQAIQELLQIAEESGGIAYAQEQLECRLGEALLSLDLLPQNEATEAIRLFITYLKERKF